MDADELALELMRLNIRMEIHEVILMRIRFQQHLQPLAPLPDPEQAISSAEDEVLSEIESIGAATERAFLNPASSRTDAQRAMYAEEIREIVENMKTYVLPPPRAKHSARISLT